MFSKLAIFFISAVALVSALPGNPAADGGAAPPGSVTVNKTTNKCNVGSLQCCQSTHKSSDKAAQQQLGLVNGALGSVSGLIALQCNPISAIAALGTGSNCNANPVCCKKVFNNGVVAAGCTPVNLNA